MLRELLFIWYLYFTGPAPEPQVKHQITVDYVGDALTNEEVLEVLALNLREYVNRCELEDNAPDAMVACIERMLGGDYQASYTAVIIE